MEWDTFLALIMRSSMHSASHSGKYYSARSFQELLQIYGAMQLKVASA